MQQFAKLREIDIFPAFYGVKSIQDHFHETVFYNCGDIYQYQPTSLSEPYRKQITSDRNLPSI
jgi:hypothetical protein